MRLTDIETRAKLTYHVDDVPPRLIIKQFLDATPIGRICLRSLKDRFLNVVSSSVSDEVQGRGYGKMLYLEAIKETKKRGLPMSSDFIVSPSALRVWQSLKRSGMGVVDNPHVEHSRDGGFQSTDDNPVFWIE